jgi:hypothetical protein
MIADAPDASHDDIIDRRDLYPCPLDECVKALSQEFLGMDRM